MTKGGEKWQKTVGPFLSVAIMISIWSASSEI